MIGEGILNALRAAAGIGVSVRDTDRRVYSGDLWPRIALLRLGGRSVDAEPDAIVWPRTAETVGRILRICSEAGIPVIPFGGGSGVCGGTVPVQGGVMLDLKRMNRLIRVDELSMSVEVEAGMIGQHLETALNERGYTLGHFPSSIMCSTAGGWVATRSAGQFSSRYGKIEDMVLGMDVVLADGTLATVDGLQRHPGAPNFCQLFLGAEGTLGVVTRVKFRVYPAPAARQFGAYRFMDVLSGLEAMRNIMQKGLRPAVMRLYDPLDTLINNFSMSAEREDSHEAVSGWHDEALNLLAKATGLDVRHAPSLLTGPLLTQFLSHPGTVQHLMKLAPLSSLLVVGFEGDGPRTRENLAQASEMAVRATGRELGPEPGEFWYRHRYSVSFKLSKIFGRGAFADTLEVAGLWRDVPEIYRAVRGAVMNKVAVMAHFSHAYREGCALYFTFSGFHRNKQRMLDLYDRIIRLALTRAMQAGATVSHHHGIGLMKRAYTPDEYRGGERLFWAVKQSLDPASIMNPHKVYPPTVPLEAPGIRSDTGEGTEFESVMSWEHRTHGFRGVAPEVPDEIEEILFLARQTGRTIVSLQTPPEAERPSNHDRPTTLLDLSGMDEILEMDPVSGTVTVQAGMTVLQLENYLREKGFTLGFVPRSRLLLNISDYLSMASPGEGSPLYGTVDENCLGLSAVVADGSHFMVRPCPRRSAGPDLMYCFLGANGRFGVITGACLRVFPIPQVREAIAFASDDPVLTVSAVRTILVRQARPESVLVVIRAPNTLGNRKRVRVVFQFGGDQASVSMNLYVVRSVMESLGMEGEAVRAEERMSPQASRSKAIQRYLSMDRVLDHLGELAEMEDPSCPEAHVTDIAPHGATLRLLAREDAHRFPESFIHDLRPSPLPEALGEAADRLKDIIDPEGVLNPM